MRRKKGNLTAAEEYSSLTEKERSEKCLKALAALKSNDVQFQSAKRPEARFKFTSDEFFALDDLKLIPFQQLLKDDDCFREVKIEWAEYVNFLAVNVIYDNACIEIISYKGEIRNSNIKTAGRIGSYLYELQNDLCDYVLWFSEKLFSNNE